MTPSCPERSRETTRGVNGLFIIVLLEIILYWQLRFDGPDRAKLLKNLVRYIRVAAYRLSSFLLAI